MVLVLGGCVIDAAAVVAAVAAAEGGGGVGKTRLAQKGSESPFPLAEEEEEEEAEEEEEEEDDCVGLRLLRAADAALWCLACRVAKRGARHCWRREGGMCSSVAAAMAAPFLPCSTT